MGSGFDPLFLLQQIASDMTHPIIPQVLILARPLAQELGLEIIDAVFHTNQSPPVLQLKIRNLTEDTGLNDCENFSRALDERLEERNIFPDAYVMEISSPGLSDHLSTDRDYVTFRGFPVLVKARESFKGKTEWTGLLVEKKETVLTLNLKGRMVSIPLDVIEQVVLETQAEEL
jgi:ribosome maturation factor RimP